MKFDEDKRYTNKEIIKAMNIMQQNLASAIGGVGTVAKDNKNELMRAIQKVDDKVVVVDDWRKAVIAVEKDRQLRASIEKNPNQQIIKELTKVIGIIAAALVAAVGGKALL